MSYRRLVNRSNHILNSILQVAILGRGIISSSAIEIIDVERQGLEMNQDDKPSLYEYFGGSDPTVAIKYIMTFYNKSTIYDTLVMTELSK